MAWAVESGVISAREGGRLKGGEPVLVRVKSLAGVPCRVRYAGKEVSLSLKKGEAWEGR